jgi:hypothetical protein
MVSRYGNLDFQLGDTNYSVCIGPPLGNASCPSSPAPKLVNTERFFHHSTDIGSYNMWCRLLAAYNTADEIPQSRSGWQKVANCVDDPDPVNCKPGWQWWLRSNAFKVFVGVTDDNPLTNDAGNSQRCTTASGFTNNQTGAQNFDKALRTLGPDQFGAYDENDPDANRNYAWYSIVGMSPKASPNQTVPYEPEEAVVGTHCTTGGGAENPGQGYQYLSKLTGGLRYSNCLNDDFDAMFQAVADGVISGSKTSCEYDVPVPEGGIVDLDETKVTYIPGGGGADVALTRAADEAACNGGAGFYFNQALDKLFLCPSSCTTVQGDDEAKLNIDFGCLGS